MALTGHRVICFDENGKNAKPRIESNGYVAEVYKEHISVNKDGEYISSVYDGYARFGDITVIVKGDYKKILFCMEANGDKLRFGLAKHEDTNEITMEDFKELSLFISYLASGLYTPGYSSWTWLFGYTPDNLIVKAIEKISGVYKQDQGDNYFAEHLGFKEQFHK